LKAIKKYGIVRQAWIKCMRFFVAHFPANAVRIWALRQCGFHVGEEVYIAGGLSLSMMNSENSCDLIIEDRVSIGPRVTLIMASDPNHSRLIKIFPPIRGSITIGKDAWLGAGVIILPNVVIGECAAIAAGAVVTGNIEPNTLSGGVPSKLIKHLPKID
jgi:acetyltransferase-like isoleucine patch superfamily enzyme